MTEKEYLEKILNGEELSESDLNELVCAWSIDEIDGECGRWTQTTKTIVELCDKYFAIDWERGLTEMQENEFYNQPYEVIKVEKMVKVTDWANVKGENK